jgi:hypothetical protein
MAGNLSGADFELDPPGTVSDATLLLNIRGLASLRYKYSPHSLVELRETYKKAGMREPERELTYALNHTRREKYGKKGASRASWRASLIWSALSGPASMA